MRNNLFLLICADITVRSAYQIGKSPVLPVFAASIGASEVYLGFIVSVSVITGMATKPIFGFLSDRWGQWFWIIVGTVLFSGFPTLYWLVRNPDDLLLIRLGHGFATAIYGPVTLAYIGSLALPCKAAGFGWFGLGRGASNVIGPVAGGLLLSVMSAPAIYTLTGVISLLAFIPILLLDKPSRPEKVPPVRIHLQQAISTVTRTPTLWFLSSYETFLFIAVYALKTFLPIYALSKGMDIAMVGFFFGLQEAVAILCRPFAGILGDRMGYSKTIIAGLSLVAISFLILSLSGNVELLSGVALLLGIGSGLVHPSTQALLSVQVRDQDQGVAFGVIGSVRNASKVMGPLLGGVLISFYGFEETLKIFSGLLFMAIIFVIVSSMSPPIQPESETGKSVSD